MDPSYHPNRWPAEGMADEWEMIWLHHVSSHFLRVVPMFMFFGSARLVK